jgi:hypothetical protein
MAITVQNKKTTVWAWVLALAMSAAIIWLVFIFANQKTPEQDMPPTSNSSSLLK